VNKTLENWLKDTARPFLTKGRGGDWDHTLRAVEYGRYLLEHEEGDDNIVIPALYLHDIGWSQVDFQDFLQASPGQKVDTPSLASHMRVGASLAGKILRDYGWDPVKTLVIVEIIAIHDEPDRVSAMENPSANLVVEADRLDRFGPESVKRYNALFGEDVYLMGRHRDESTAYLQDGMRRWFKTKTARALAEKLRRETGISD